MSKQQSQIEAELRQLPVSSDWPDGTIVEIARLAKIVNCPPGTVIFRQGDATDLVGFVVSGRVALEMTVPARGSVRLLTLSRGELLGWSPLVGGHQMTATAVAIDETQLLSIPGDALLKLCQQNHELGFEVMRRVAWALSRRLTATRLQLLDLFSPTAPAVAEPRPELNPRS